ncbi:hypothetical protein N7454_006327 [Penicillium verhagenii]|nr:hypothetical protein N7454_006327 [Penicillium verhagenii]
MERVKRTFFDPLASSKAQIRDKLEKLPVGSAHPFSPERLLLCRTDDGIDEINISSCPDSYFIDPVDLGVMGKVLLKRMTSFKSELEGLTDYIILQAPSPSFKLPIVSGKIVILAVSKTNPTYFDLCLADASYNTCSYRSKTTFPGITHSGDIYNRNSGAENHLDYVRMDKEYLTDKEICIFIYGFEYTQIAYDQNTNPALLVADHVDQVLYIIPVPLDRAMVGKATICCPLVVRRDGDSLICSILPKATTDNDVVRRSDRLVSPCFPDAVKHANFTISASTDGQKVADLAEENGSVPEVLSRTIKEHALFTTGLATLPSFLDLKRTQVISFGTRIKFELPDKEPTTKSSSTIVLPCIFGCQLEGPMLLSTGKTPLNIPFVDKIALRDYYTHLKSAVFIVNDKMTDNARNLATNFRINALFIVKLSQKQEPKSSDDITSLLNSTNINAVTALAGPQSLILIQICDKYYFHRGIANRAHINTSHIEFGGDLTSILESVGAESILDPRIERMITLGEHNPVILPRSGQWVLPQDLPKLLEGVSVDDIQKLEEDIPTAVPQLEMLLNEKDLQDLSKALVSILSVKTSNMIALLRNSYSKFKAKDFCVADPDSVKKRNEMLADLRKTICEINKALQPLTLSLAEMISFQTTSKRTHDVQGLLRQTKIQSNLEAVKTMTFGTLAEYLEIYAEDMGVMLINIHASAYRRVLASLKKTCIDASRCCDLDSRVLHLGGFDAGIIIQQLQGGHDGPLGSTIGASHPILVIPKLTETGTGNGSMLAWVCWDEFVNLKDPYTVRWMEKCNDEHIAALRIIMRSTLSQATISKHYELQPGGLKTGYLMGALLMAAMTKLAARRETVPVVSEESEDTITRLMRGLFGNLLTMAGSGVRPLSMVWQLFSVDSSYVVPRTGFEWRWYKTAVALSPYAGWPLEPLHTNLAHLLDKVIFSMISKSDKVARAKEDSNKVGTSKKDRTSKMIRSHKLRNIQLDHYRTIITVLMRTFDVENVDIAAITTRLLDHIPKRLESLSGDYSRMLGYLKRLAQGGERSAREDHFIANIYVLRSGCFGELKNNVAEAHERGEWSKMKGFCQEIVDKRTSIASFWRVKAESLKVQNFEVYKALLNQKFGENIDMLTMCRNWQLIQQVRDDAERLRVPWRVGLKGECVNEVEPRDEEFFQAILTGENLELFDETSDIEVTGDDLNFEWTKSVNLAAMMETDFSSEDACRMMDIPVKTMRVFTKALHPEFVWEDLEKNFKETIKILLAQPATTQAGSRPSEGLFGLGKRK